MNTAQNKMVYALLNKTGLLPQKENIVLGISNGRTASTRELSHEESIALIGYLQQQDKEPGEDPRTAMRNKIFYYAHQLGWTKLNKHGKQVADGKRVDEWMIEYSYLKKKLNRYSYKELPKLVSQFEAMYRSYLKKQL